MSQHTHEIHVLNGLIETTIDSVDGYTEAAKDAESVEFRDLFLARAMERRQVAARLREAVRREGGEPADDGTVLASAHRVFVGLRNTLSRGDKAVIDEVERGEDHIKSKYDDALKDDKLSLSARESIQQAYTSVRQGHDQMSAIKHAIRPGTH
ncbi:PA2169 family four-helix-bundle protein [Dyella sp. C11]|uniref:ferritin-like domain-containing protein n=1 Tax=Dyella sp. C11 TaxID=2126991 RepID=UPI000D64E7BF|nr:PA2169 family four-helix-bundle protein [Dyella sp. C11]